MDEGRKLIESLILSLGILILLISQQTITGSVIYNVAHIKINIVGVILIIAGIIMVVSRRHHQSELEIAVNKIPDIAGNPGDYKNKSIKSYERLIEIRKILEKHDDKIGINLIRELIHNAGNYVRSIAQMDRALSDDNLKMRLSTEDYQEKTEELDRNRRIKHNALLSQFTATNRYLFKHYKAGKEVPYGGVYSLSIDDIGSGDVERKRHAIGDWAGYLLYGLYLEGEL